MICTIAEVIAILAESYLAAHLLIRYFGMKKEYIFWMKHILFFTLLSISDLLGTFVFSNENFLVLSCLSIEIIFAEFMVSQDISRILCLFITKMLYFAAVQFILWMRKKEKHYFNLNEWIIIISVFLITLLIGLAMYIIIINDKINDYIYLASTLLLSLLDVIMFIFMRNMNVSSQKEREKELLHIQLA